MEVWERTRGLQQILGVKRQGAVPVTFLPDSQLHCFLSPPETDTKNLRPLARGLFSAPKPFGDPDCIPQTCIGNYN